MSVQSDLMKVVVEFFLLISLFWDRIFKILYRHGADKFCLSILPVFAWYPIMSGSASFELSIFSAIFSMSLSLCPCVAALKSIRSVIPCNLLFSLAISRRKPVSSCPILSERMRIISQPAHKNKVGKTLAPDTFIIFLP